MMNKSKLILSLLLITAFTFCFAVTAVATSSEEPLADLADQTSGSDLTVWIIIASALAFAATVSVVLVNKKTAKYRKAFKKKKK